MTDLNIRACPSLYKKLVQSPVALNLRLIPMENVSSCCKGSLPLMSFAVIIPGSIVAI